MPVAAVVGGIGGELVRIIQIEPETLGWSDDGVTFKFETESFQTIVQGVWLGNSGRIRQLQFAVLDGAPTEWLAVRYETTISILRVILREEELPLQYKSLSTIATGADFQLRFELEHIASLPAQHRTCVAFADIRFNPWNLSELAILDQASRWCVWIIRCVKRDRDTWKLEPGPSGRLMQDSSNKASRLIQEKYLPEGWGKVHWIGKGAGLLICNRTSSVIMELRNPAQRSIVLDVRLHRPQDRILDVKQDSEDSEHFFIATSSRILWARIMLKDFEEIEQPSFDNEILLGWLHFCNVEDVSLSIQLTSMESKKLVLLYSRLRNVKIVFTFDLNKHNHRPPSSVCDPHSFPDMDHNGQAPLFFAMLPVKSIFSERRGDARGGPKDADEGEGTLTYLKLVQLNSDLSLQECLLCGMPDHQRAPRRLSRRHTSRSSRKVQDDLMVPNGVLLSIVEELRPEVSPIRGGQTVVPNPKTESMIIQTSEDQWTISFEWLRDRISSSTSVPFEKACHILSRKFTAKQESMSLGMVSLLIRGIAAQVHLASYGLGQQLIDRQIRQVPRISYGEDQPMSKFPVRGHEASSTASRQAKVEDPVQTFAEPGASRSSRDNASIPIANLPTPEPTPSIQSQGSSSVVGEREDSASQRLRALASLAPQPQLPSVMKGILSHWSIGQNPDNYDWEGSQISLYTSGDSTGLDKMTPRKKQKPSAQPSRQQVQSTVGAFSQPMPIRLGASQAGAPRDSQPSSQFEPITMSQPQPGHFGSSSKLRKKRRQGF
ncbi:MAG: hypothetical protein Q9220_004240 [cf. Caloplaca sp. 1 TL-2023]